jgi:hypothetical protein
MHTCMLLTAETSPRSGVAQCTCGRCPVVVMSRGLHETGPTTHHKSAAPACTKPKKSTTRGASRCPSVLLPPLASGLLTRDHSCTPQVRNQWLKGSNRAAMDLEGGQAKPQTAMPPPAEAAAPARQASRLASLHKPGLSREDKADKVSMVTAAALQRGLLAPAQLWAVDRTSGGRR